MDKNNGSKSTNGYDVLGDIGKVLAEALRDFPGFAAIVLILLIFAMVAMGLAAYNDGFDFAVWQLFVLAIIAILVIAFLVMKGVGKQKARNSALMPEGTDVATMYGLVENLDHSDKEVIRRLICEAAKEVAGVLKVSADSVRSNLFFADSKSYLKILPDLTHNMAREEEKTITIPVGYGSTGHCFSARKSNIAVFREGWGKYAIEDKELKKSDPNLQWIVSVPIMAQGTDVQPIGVLNIDGLHDRMHEKELRSVVARVFYWSQAIAVVITSALKKVTKGVT